MEADDLCTPHFQVTTYRDGQAVIIETLDTEIAAKTRFASAIDLCKSIDGTPNYKVELRGRAAQILDIWPST